MNLGAQLSLQLHYQRAKNWVVASGMAEIINGDISRLHTENQSTYTPLRTVHRLKNPGTIPLVIIEIQSGSYLAKMTLCGLMTYMAETNNNADSQRIV